jgi:hypothetical protein
MRALRAAVPSEGWAWEAGRFRLPGLPAHAVYLFGRRTEATPASLRVDG